MISKSITIAADDNWVYAYASLNGKELARDADASTLIQLALDRLQGEGGSVTIEPGTYVLTKPLQLPSRMQLKGSGSATVLSVCESNLEGVGLMLASVHNVTVSDINIEAPLGSETSKSGIVVDNCADCSFHEVFCLNFCDYGFLLRNGSAFCKVTNCKAANNAKANFCLSHLDRFRTGDYGDFVPNLVSSCYSYGGGVGFLVDKALCQNFIACVAYQAGKAAFHVANWSNSTLISGCRSFQTEEQAVLIEDSSEINISSSIFCWQRGHGIEVKNSTWGTICGNEIMDAGASSDAYKYNLYLHTDVKSYQVT
ncbi:MAG: right-handed parallel beta-helix repeat-containing protein, partial [Verrucomicrobiota bacterium]